MNAAISTFAQKRRESIFGRYVKRPMYLKRAIIAQHMHNALTLLVFHIEIYAKAITDNLHSQRAESTTERE